MVGQVIGSYKVISELGRGGMGLVMLAKHIHLNRSAAIKLLQRSLCDNAEAVQRFLVEARATAEIQHPGIVQIYDCGILPDGIAFIIMELLEGETLQASLSRRGFWPVEEAAVTLIQIVDALAAAHRIGIVHRDLKPENIFLLSQKRIKLVDFGIAKLAEREYSVKTVSGTIMGTPRYMSPEQCRGSLEVDFRSDIYSLGCVFFEMLTNQPVFPQENFGQVIAAHLLLQPPDPRIHCPHLPHDVAALILAMLAKGPADRPSLAEIKSLLSVYSSKPITEPGVGPFLTPIPSYPPTPMPLTAQQGFREGIAPRPVTLPVSSTQSIRGERALSPQFGGSTLSGAPREQPSEQNADLATMDLVPRRRARLAIAAGAVGAAAIAVIVVLALRPHGGAPVAPPPTPAPIVVLPAAVSATPSPPAPAPTPVLPTAVPAAPSRPIQPEPVPVAEPAAKEAARPSVAHPRSRAEAAAREAAAPRQDTKVSLILTSVPSGALICNGSERIGITDANVSLHRSSKKQTLTLYKSGYRQETVTVTADRDVSKAVRLRPLAIDDLREPPPCR